MKISGRVDVVAQYRITSVHIARKQALEQFLAEGRIALYARLDRFLEISRQGHGFQVSQYPVAGASWFRPRV